MAWRRPSAGIFFIRPLGTNFSEILIEIYTFSFKKIHLKMSLEMAAILSRPQWVNSPPPPWTQWPPIWQTTFSNAFSSMKSFVFRFKIQGSLFLWVQIIYASIGLDNGLAPNRRLAIFWTNVDPIHWHIHVCGTRGRWVNSDKSSQDLSTVFDGINHIIWSNEQHLVAYLCDNRYSSQYGENVIDMFDNIYLPVYAYARLDS